MTSADPTTAAPDLQFADAIARAEQRRAVLERLVEIGMVLAEEVGARKVDAPPRAEPRHDPCRSFAAVSRAVRLSLAFASRIDAEIIAMRNSEVKPPNRPAAPKRAPDKAEVASFPPARSARKASASATRCGRRSTRGSVTSTEPWAPSMNCTNV